MQCHNRGSREERKGEECEEMKREKEEGCRLGRSDEVDAWIAGKGKKQKKVDKTKGCGRGQMRPTENGGEEDSGA